MKRVFITGASGFVGSMLARRLVSRGCEVHVLLREDSQNLWRLKEIRQDVRIHKGNLLNASLIRKILSKVKPDWIFHLAAFGGYSFQVDTKKIIETNFIASVGLVDAAVKVGFDSFVNVGSSSEYGFKNERHKETLYLEPNSCYAVSKAACTHYASFVANSQKVNIPTMRLYSIYGPFEDPRRLIPQLLSKVKRNRFPPLVDRKVSRDFVYVDDAVEALILAAKRNPQENCWGNIYNVSSGKATTMEKLVLTIRNLFGVIQDPVWSSMKNRDWDTKNWVGDNSKIKKELGWLPRVTLEDGLQLFSVWMETYKTNYE